MKFYITQYFHKQPENEKTRTNCGADLDPGFSNSQHQCMRGIQDYCIPVAHSRKFTRCSSFAPLAIFMLLFLLHNTTNASRTQAIKKQAILYILDVQWLALNCGNKLISSMTSGGKILGDDACSETKSLNLNSKVSGLNIEKENSDGISWLNPIRFGAQRFPPSRINNTKNNRFNMWIVLENPIFKTGDNEQVSRYFTYRRPFHLLFKKGKKRI